MRSKLLRLSITIVLLILPGARGAEPSTEPTLQPVPLLSPDDEAKTFVLPPGFHAEVVAAEPMVQHPVAIAFDPDGRLWVAEMRNYMPDVFGTGETKPSGRISVLEDTDGDGRMDKATVFLDHLVLPRAVGFAGDGVLVGSPPNLYFCRDLDHDGKCDEKRIIATDFGIPENPENSANGLLYNLDNWYYNANYTQRFRYRDGRFIFEPLPDLGQYGISRDDLGHLFFNTNSDYLRASLVPPHYSSRNPTSPMGIADTRIATDQAVFPINASTVNRGYRTGFLNKEGKLAAFTAACSPCVYRADLFPPDFYGNIFVCEATSGMIRRAIVTTTGTKLSAKNAYSGKEFLASTYERFRPVSLSVGPDGALYIVDMHHGLIQHKMSLTEYGKKQYLQKQLDKHLMTGRIYRIVPDGAMRAASPNLSKASTDELIKLLSHPNGWYRDTAQRLLGERNDQAAVAPLTEMVADPTPLNRIIALWTLEGMGRLDFSMVQAALQDPDMDVRTNAIRLAEAFPKEGTELLPDAATFVQQDERAQIQITLSIGILPAAHTVDQLAKILPQATGSAALRQAAVSDLHESELSFLQKVLADPAWSSNDNGHAALLKEVARSLINRDDARDIALLAQLLGHSSANQTWQQIALLDALPPVRHDDFGFTRTINLSQEPAVIAELRASSDKLVRAGADKVAALFNWPGKPQPPHPKPAPLTDAQQKLFELGRTQFTTICSQCHGPDGLGLPGKAPPLVGSPWVLGPDKRLIRILLHGLHGPITVHEKAFNADMPAVALLSDEKIAGVLTFIRRSWNHEAPAVDPAAVHEIRDWNQARREAWTERELLQIH